MAGVQTKVTQNAGKARLISLDGDQNCKVCKDLMQSVEYYLAKKSNEPGTGNGFTDICKHTGYMCLHCGLKKDNKKLLAGIIMLLSGIALTIVFTYASLSTSQYDLSMMPNGRLFADIITLIVIFGMAMIIAGFVFTLSKKPFRRLRNRNINQEYLESVFVKLAGKEYPREGYVYLPFAKIQKYLSIKHSKFDQYECKVIDNALTYVMNLGKTTNNTNLVYQSSELMRKIQNKIELTGSDLELIHTCLTRYENDIPDLIAVNPQYRANSAEILENKTYIEQKLLPRLSLHSMAVNVMTNDGSNGQ